MGAEIHQQKSTSLLAHVNRPDSTSTMTSKTSPHVLILGAGIGGLTLAQSLRKKGISYEIFERDRGDHVRPEGWAIGIHT